MMSDTADRIMHGLEEALAHSSGKEVAGLSLSKVSENHSGPFLEERRQLEYIANLTMKVARPLIWHDVREPWPKRLNGGTCFILRFNTCLIGVTAEHVIKAYEDAKRLNDQTLCLLRTIPFDLSNAIINRSVDLDIATFRVTEDQLAASEAIEIDCRSEWPPSLPDIGRELSLGGFPNLLQTAYPHSPMEFRAYVHLACVEEINDRDIFAIYDSQRGDARIQKALEFPDTGANLSGCSGGPVLMHFERSGLHRWLPVGLIVQGPGTLLDGELSNVDIFRLRRIHFIKDDGSIREQNIGWLPS